MVNVNGTLVDTFTGQLSLENRGYKYGDALFETLKVLNSNILFWEDHYFRLMASMRILRMEIPMTFTMEFLEQEILKTIAANHLNASTVRVRLNIDRGDGGKYSPEHQRVHYSILTEPMEESAYTISEFTNYQVDLFKDYVITPGLLSTLKTNNKVLHVLGSIYAKEQDLNNCLLMNTNKQIVEALNGNVFLVSGNSIKTPPLEDGCLKGIMRKQVLELLKQEGTYEVLETSISPFELIKADELFITNVIQGVQPVGFYRKKTYTNKVSALVVERLKAKIGVN